MQKKKLIFSAKGSTRYRQHPASRRKRWRWILGALVLVSLLIFFTGNKSLLKLYSLHRQKNQLIEQKENLIQQSDQLEKEIDQLKTNDQYLEKVAREKYNLKKEKEDVYIVEPK